MSEAFHSETFIYLMIALLVLTFYLAPWLVANGRGAKHQGGIFVLNLFLGWTGLGWIGALVWAVSDNVKEIK